MRTFGDIKPYLKNIAGLPCDDAGIAMRVNEAQMLLKPKAKWINLVQRLRFCADQDGCITWPRQVLTVEAWSICGFPGIIRNRWFEFQQNSPGFNQSCQGYCTTQMTQADSACVYAQPVGVNKLIATYTDVVEVSDAFIIYQGYDENKNWIRTEPLGPGTGYIDGEKVSLATSPINTTKKFTNITGVLKSETKGNVRAYSFVTGPGTLSPLAVYEPDETRPQYTRSIVPGLCATPTGTNCDGSPCTIHQVDVIVKLRFIPVKYDNDWLMISNVAAIKAGIQCILDRETGLSQRADDNEAKAYRALSEELLEVQGKGAVPTLRRQDPRIWGMRVPNVLGGFTGFSGGKL